MIDEETSYHIRLELETLEVKARQLLGLEVTGGQLNKFFQFAHLLLEWNEKINLTAITSPADMVIKHFLDSLVFVKWLKTYAYTTDHFVLGDIGTGAGFPGIPVRIMLPDLQIVLIDALAKRINYLDEIIFRLGLDNIRTCHARAEDIGRDRNYRESFDVIMARAVAELSVLLEYSSPLLKINGRLFAAKGVEPEREIEAAGQAIHILHCKLEKLEKYSLADEAQHRALLVFLKTGHTPGEYPRQAGRPKKVPL